MYYRRKILLSLLQEFDNRLSKIALQKLLFLFTRIQQDKAFDFVPYKFGCFSFQANYDLKVLSKYDLLAESGNENTKSWIKTDKNNYSELLKSTDKQILNQIIKQFRNFSEAELIKHTYLHYPYYAGKSTILSMILNQEEIKQVRKKQKSKSESQLFTIGYEGKSFDFYLNQLLINNISLLLDIRRNPISKKYGFSKSQLKNACENLGIVYRHIPELGIDSTDRRDLSSEYDYKKLFMAYEQEIVLNHRDVLVGIQKEIDVNKRIALTCFEADHERCHRGIVVKLLCQLPDWDCKVTHL